MSWDLANVYAWTSNHKEALPICLKASEIYKNQLGHNLMEVVEYMKLLAIIYT